MHIAIKYALTAAVAAGVGAAGFAAIAQTDPKVGTLATDPIGPLAKGQDPAELAAWTLVGNVLLNLDEVFAKR